MVETNPFGICLILYSILLISSFDAKKITEVTEDNCEVCLNFVTKFIDTLDETTKKSPEKIEAAIRKTCKATKKDDNRFCYYIGGLEESATGMLGELSKPISWSMPADKVCMKLYRKDAQICDLRYEKSFDFSKIDVKKLKVSELKKILSDWDEQCKGCSEKSDYVKMVEELLPKYATASDTKKNEL